MLNVLFRKGATCGALIGLLAAAPVHAVPSLFDWGFNIDGTTTCSFTLCDSTGPLPAEIDATGFDFGLGTGNVTMSLTGAGTHYVSMFVDHDIDAGDNTFFNENGTVNGTAAAGQSYEIDEPGFIFGDIDVNFVDGTLDNSNNVPAGLEDDVSMALAWGFTLLADEIATVTFDITEFIVSDASFFNLELFDPDSNEGVRFASALNIRPIKAVPEPATWMLMLTGLLLIGRRVRAAA